MPGQIVVGAVAVEVVPSAADFAAKLTAQIVPQAGKIGEAVGDAMGKRAGKGLQDGVEDGLKESEGKATREGEKSGAKFSGAFARAANAGLRAAQSALPKVSVDAVVNTDLHGVYEDLAALKASFATLTTKHLSVQIDSDEALAEMGKLRAELAVIARDNVDIKVRVDAAGAIAAVDAFNEKILTANTSTGSFAHTLDSTLKSALASLPDNEVDLGKIFGTDSDAEAQAIVDKIQTIRAELLNLRNLRVGIDIDATEAQARTQALVAELLALKNMTIDPRILLGATEAEGQLLAWNKKVDAADGRVIHTDVKVATPATPPVVEVNTEPAKRQVGVLAAEIQTIIGTALRALPEPNLHLNTDPAKAELAEIYGALQLLGEFKIGVDLDPKQALAEIAVLRVALQTLLDRSDLHIEIKAGGEKALAVIDGLTAKVEKLSGVSAPAERKVGALATRVQSAAASMRAALADRFDFKFEVEGIAGLAELLPLVDEVARLNDLKIGVDINAGPALIKMKLLVESLEAIAAHADVDIEVKHNIDKAVKPARALLEELGLLDKIKVEPKVIEPKVKPKLDTSELGGLANAVRSAMAKVVAAIPKVSLDADSSPLDAALQGIRLKAASIHARVGVDLDSGKALAEARVVDSLLSEILKDKTVNVRYKTDAKIAQQATQALASSLGEVSLESGKATGALGGLLSSFDGMGPAAAVTNGAIVLLFAAIPALVAVASAAIFGLLGLLAFVGAVVGGLALGIGVLLFAFKDIIQAIQEKDQQAKTAALNAAQDDQTELANKIALVGANRAIAAAEKTLAKARVSELDARKKLNQSYKDAKTELAKLTQEIRSNRVEQQQTLVTITQAREAYNRLLADPTASESAIEAAQAEYNTKEEALRKLQIEQRKNLDEKAKYDKDGLKGNAAYAAALKAVADAVASVSDAENGLKQSRADKANTLAQQAAAAKVTALQRKDQTSKFDNLDPAAKTFVEFYESTLKPMLHDLMGAAQTAILPGITAFFKGLSTPATLTALTTAITQIGTAFGGLLTKLGGWLASKDGQAFIKWLGDSGATGLETLGKLLGMMAPLVPPLTKAFTDLMKRMTPKVIESMSGAVQKLVGWLSSKSFKDFIDEMVTNGPLLIDDLVGLAGALTTLLRAAGPAGTALLKLVGWISELVTWMGPGGLVAAFAILAVIAAGVALYLGGPVLVVIGLIVVAVFAVVSAFIYAWRRFKWFRDVLTDVWHFIEQIFSPHSLYHAFVKPFVSAWHVVEQIFSPHSLYHAFVQPFVSVWDGIESLFHKGVDKIKGAWGRLKDILADPLHAVIGLINRDLIGPINKVAHFAGAGGIQPIADPTAKHMAHGGVLPGYAPGVDVIPVLASPGEGWLVPQAVLQLGRDTIEEWNLRARHGQPIQKFAVGGVVEKNPPTTHTKATGLAGRAVDYIEDRLAAPLERFVADHGDSPLVKMLVAIPTKLMEGVTAFLIEKAKDVEAIGSHVLSYLHLDGEAKAPPVGVMASPQTAAAYAKGQLGTRGWDGAQMQPLAALWTGESGWRWNAKNPHSGAYGIAQALPASKYASAGADWATDAYTQVRWGLDYIHDRYGSPQAAYDAWLSRTPHWYDTGGYLPPGLTLAYNGTGQNERVLTAEQEAQMLSGRAQGGGGVEIGVRVHDGAIPGLVEATVDRQFGMLADAHIYGGN